MEYFPIAVNAIVGLIVSMAIVLARKTLPSERLRFEIGFEHWARSVELVQNVAETMRTAIYFLTLFAFITALITVIAVPSYDDMRQAIEAGRQASVEQKIGDATHSREDSQGQNKAGERGGGLDIRPSTSHMAQYVKKAAGGMKLLVGLLVALGVGALGGMLGVICVLCSLEVGARNWFRAHGENRKTHMSHVILDGVPRH